MDYDAMTRRVLARAKEYEARRKKRRKTALRVGIPALCALALAVGIAYAARPAEQPALSAPAPAMEPAAQGDPVNVPDDSSTETLYIPALELPEPQEGVEADMIGLVVFHGAVYTEAQMYLGDEAETVKKLAAQHLGRARGNIDEWSAQDDYATELASTCSGEIYTVSGYDPNFRLCAVQEMLTGDGTTVPWVWFMERLNGISLATGADLFDARLCLPGRIESARYENHADWNEGRNNWLPLDNVEAVERLIEAACAGKFAYVHDEQPDFYSRERRQVHLRLTLTDGTIAELRLFEGGWLGYQPLGWYFVNIPGEAFDAVFDGCE